MISSLTIFVPLIPKERITTFYFLSLWLENLAPLSKFFPTSVNKNDYINP